MDETLFPVLPSTIPVEKLAEVFLELKYLKVSKYSLLSELKKIQYHSLNQ